MAKSQWLKAKSQSWQKGWEWWQNGWEWWQKAPRSWQTGLRSWQKALRSWHIQTIPQIFQRLTLETPNWAAYLASNRSRDTSTQSGPTAPCTMPRINTAIGDEKVIQAILSFLDRSGAMGP